MPLLAPLSSERQTNRVEFSHHSKVIEGFIRSHQSTDASLRHLAARLEKLEEELHLKRTGSSPIQDVKTPNVIEILFLETDDDLGLIVQCDPHEGMIVREIRQGSIPFLYGVYPGDRLVSCNGIPSESLGGSEDLAALLELRPMMIQISHVTAGMGTKSYQRAKTSLTQPWKVVTPTFLSIVAVLGATSPVAKWVLFLGGFAELTNPKLHILYLLVFVLSLSTCFISCAANLVFQKPPYTNILIDALTMYLHVFGLHTWLRWRGFVRNPELRGLVMRCLCKGHSSIRPELLDELIKHIRVVSRALAGVQIALVVLGYYILPTRSLEHWMEHSQSATGISQTFVLVHGGLMYLALPLHLPTVVAAYGLLFMVCRLHALDVGRFKHLMGGVEERNSVRTDVQGLLHFTADLAVETQERLTATCSNLQGLLLHQFAYIFLQLFVAGVEAKTYYREGIDDNESLAEILYKVWHLCLGLLGLAATALAPAGVTAAFTGTREYVYQGLRARGADQRFARLGAEDVAYSTTGFHCLGVAVSPHFVSSFISILLIGLALVIDLTA